MKSAEINQDWFSTYYFSWDTLSGFIWENPLFLYLIPLIPALFLLRWAIHLKFKTRLVLAFLSSDKHAFKNNIFRYLPTFLLSVSLACILIALARPQIIETDTQSFAEGVNILLAMDISESMEIQDLKPNRLKASIKVASEFISGRPHDQIGLLVFSSTALSLSPLTFDHIALKQWLNNVNTNLLVGSGTAIGTAIATGINRLTEVDAKSKVIILISDGENTAGTIDPVTAAKMASAFGIQIYSIAIGKNGEVPFYNKETGKTSLITSHLNEETLKEVAKLSSGAFFRATDLKELTDVFSKINILQKQKIKVTESSRVEDYYHIYLSWAIVFFLLWLLTKSTFLTNSLED